MSLPRVKFPYFINCLASHNSEDGSCVPLATRECIKFSNRTSSRTNQTEDDKLFFFCFFTLMKTINASTLTAASSSFSLLFNIHNTYFYYSWISVWHSSCTLPPSFGNMLLQVRHFRIIRSLYYYSVIRNEPFSPVNKSNKRNSFQIDGTTNHHQICFVCHKNGCHKNDCGRRNRFGGGANQIEKLPIIEPIAVDDLPASFVMRHKDSDLLFQSEFEISILSDFPLFLLPLFSLLIDAPVAICSLLNHSASTVYICTVTLSENRFRLWMTSVALPDRFKDRSTVASDSPENSCKNRYPDIKAYLKEPTCTTTPPGFLVPKYSITYDMEKCRNNSKVKSVGEISHKPVAGQTNPVIKPVDQTRVKLATVDGIVGSDYINANYVQGYRGRKRFICAQGPLDKTVDDFWRMIWQHKVYIIIMLTGFEEHGKMKCSRYWNEEGENQYGNVCVSVSQYVKFSEYAVRKLAVQSKMGGIIEGKREILHFHFLMWKDFLAPDQPSWLLRFIKRVNENHCPDRGPILVHCSAGVGRTGTFVAIDSLLQMMEEEGKLDVFSCVANLRKDRKLSCSVHCKHYSSMLKFCRCVYLLINGKQYVFVYRALMEHAQFGDTEIEIMTLREHYDQLKTRMLDDKFRTKLDAEYEKLSEVIENPKTRSVGLMDINRCKNRYESILPYDTVLTAESVDKLQELLDIVVRESELMGLSLNVRKTECMSAFLKLDESGIKRKSSLQQSAYRICVGIMVLLLPPMLQHVEKDFLYFSDDVNRVILPPVPSRDQSSYINASFIQDYDKSVTYIITQDPMENTRYDFWRMIKEQTVCNIIMLSEIGHGQTQCQAYWAEEEQELQYDHLAVKLTAADYFPVYNKRNFVVTNTKTNDSQNVTQFQFKCWNQGNDIPHNTSSLLDLITQVQLSVDKTEQSKSPLLVHCSSGGERSGVYIALNILIQQMKMEQRVDVFQVARSIRAQRSHLLITVVCILQ
ncbi:Receptor-type tyrosine-protein phosphatase [Nymphon striatum]|nr:Receptor-type tyrosine-protein phosphatase [Nymphon striatum]